MSPRAEHFLVCSRSPPHFHTQLFVCREDCLQVLDGPYALPSRCRSINTFEVEGTVGGGGMKKTKVQTHTHAHTQRERFSGWICMKTSSSLSQPPITLRDPPAPLLENSPTPPRSLHFLPHPHTKHHDSCFLLHNDTTAASACLRTVANGWNTEQLPELWLTSAVRLNNYAYVQMRPALGGERIQCAERARRRKITPPPTKKTNKSKASKVRRSAV